MLDLTSSAWSEGQGFCHALLDALHANIAVLNDNGEIIEVNAAWQNFAEANNFSWPAYGVGKNYLKVCETAKGLEEAEAHLVAVNLRAILERVQEGYRMEYACHSETQKRWFSLCAVPFEHAGRTYLAVVHQNITERKVAEHQVTAHQAEVEALVAARTAQLERVNEELQQEIEDRRYAENAWRQSEMRFRELANAMPQIVWTAQADGTLDYFNQRWFEYTGLPSERAFDWEAVVHADDRCGIERWREHIASGQPYEIEERLRNARGEYRWHLTRALPVKDAAGRVVRWHGTCTDITTQKQAEQLLRDSDRRKDDFLAMLAHELRNPLGPIRNSVQILERIGPHDNALRHLREIVERQVGHIVRLVDDLLDLSRIGRGKVLLRKQPLDLGELIKTVAEDHRNNLEMGGIRLELALPEKPLWTEGDPTRLAQAVGNVLANAAKFTDRGGTVRVGLAVGGEQRATISVSDTGVGIEPATLEHLFEPFCQASRTVNRSRGGLGLGLALVKGLIELHGGSVEVYSAGLGQGAEFRLHLPTCAAPQSVEVPAEISAGECISHRILVIEDNYDAAESMRLLLELAGHQVAVAYTGAGGLETAREFRPDIVLCDLGLPGGMDGYAVGRALRVDSMLNGPYLIALTGYGQEEDQRRSHEAGFEMHLTKPVDAVALERFLGNLPVKAHA